MPATPPSEAVRQGFHPRGQPVIQGINRIGLWSLYIKEVRRFLKVQTQTIWAPAVTTLLFLVIFTVALGGSGGSGGSSDLVTVINAGAIRTGSATKPADDATALVPHVITPEPIRRPRRWAASVAG